METKIAPESPQDLLEEIRREAGYIQTYQFRIEDAIKKQQVWAEQLAERIRAGETTGDKLWDFVVGQADIKLWWNDGGELYHILHLLDQRLEAGVGQPVMLVETSVEDWPVRLTGRMEFEDQMNVRSACFPSMSMFPRMLVYKVKIGRVHRGGLIIDSEGWFLPTLSHAIIGYEAGEIQIEDAIPLPPLTEFIRIFYPASKNLQLLLSNLGHAKPPELELLIGVDEIRSWIGKCQNDQIGERILEILDELELSDQPAQPLETKTPETTE